MSQLDGNATREHLDTLLLQRSPSANRVYSAAAGPLAAREAERVLSAHLGVPVPVRERRIGGLDYLGVHLPADSGDVRALIGTLSAVLGCFRPHRRQGEGPELLLEPVEMVNPLRHGSELETTLKYPGKTNEQFTALLLNLAGALSTARAGILDGALAVLDPMCGRGTTLNRALRLGLSPVGADIDRTDIEAYRVFVLTWMREQRLKHTSSTGRLSRHGEVLGSRFDAQLARDKQEKREGRSQTIQVLRCEAERLHEVLPAGCMDAVVTDLPYGVQHGARSGGALRRSPLEALAAAAPAWRTLMRPGAGMALAINRRTAPWRETVDALERAGFAVVSADGEFRHRVDRSIERDVVLAVRDDHPEAASLIAAVGVFTARGAAAVPPAVSASETISASHDDTATAEPGATRPLPEDERNDL